MTVAAIDRREAILSRLHEIHQGLLGNPEFAFRNFLDIPETSRPASILLDGDEATEQGSPNNGRPSNAPVVVTMTPQIFLLLEAGSPKIGRAVNAYRAKYLKAVLNDTSLIALCNGGPVRYEGLATGLAIGRSMEGESGLDISFPYVLKPNEL